MHFSAQARPAICLWSSFTPSKVCYKSLAPYLWYWYCLPPNIIFSWYSWVILVLVKVVLFCALYVVNLIRHLRYEYVIIKWMCSYYHVTFVYWFWFQPLTFSFPFGVCFTVSVDCVAVYVMYIIFSKNL